MWGLGMEVGFECNDSMNGEAVATKVKNRIRRSETRIGWLSGEDAGRAYETGYREAEQ